MPESLRDLLLARAVRSQLFEAGKHPEGGGMPQCVDPSAVLDQESGDVPAAVADGVVERGPDRSTRRLQIGTTVNEHDGNL